MSKHRCPCCGWTILRAVERPDVLVACSNCSQVVRVSSVPSAAIPKCNTESMIDWGTEGAPQAPDGVPLLPVELCIPLRKSRPATAFARSGLLGMGMSIVLAFTVWRLGCESGLLQSLPARLLLLGAFGMFFLSSVRVLYLGFRRFRRYSPAQLLSVAQLPPEVERLGVPLALHRNPSGVPPAVRFLIGLSILVGAVVCAILLLLDEIWSMRLMALACLGVLSGVAAIRSAVSYRRLRVLVYRDGFVVLRGREIGVLWRWQDIESVHLQKSSHIPVMFAYTLRRRDGKTLAFDHRLEYIENQLGVRVQQALCRMLLPHLLNGLRAGQQVVFGSLRVSSEGLHHGGGCVPWGQVANLTLDGDQLTIRKWGGDFGASWSVPYRSVPNLAVFFALAQQLLRECSNEGKNALSVLADACLDSTAIQTVSSNFQPPCPLTESRSDCLQRQSGLQ